MGDDMGRHIKNGELILGGHFEVLRSNVYSYTEQDHIFVNHHWLSGVVFYLLYQAVGWNGLVIFKIVVLLSAFSMLFLTAIKKAKFWLVALLSLPAIFILGERTTLRPEIFSYLFTAAFLYLLADLEEHPERKRIFWLIPLQILWVNMHLFFIVGLALTSGFLLEKIILNRKRLRGNLLIKKLVILSVVLIAISFVNPNVVAGARYPLHIFNNYGINVSENNPPASFLTWRPPEDNMLIKVFFWMVPLLAVSFLLNLRKRPILNFLASTAVIVGAFKMLRLLPFFALIFLPAASANFNGSFVKLGNILKKTVSIRNLEKYLVGFFILLICGLIFLGVTGKFSSYKKTGIGLTIQSNDSANFFKEQSLKGPIFNNFDIGSYLIFHFFPKEKVFVDNRAEAYSASFLADTYLPMIQNETKWQKALEQYKFNVIFFYQYELGLRRFIYRRVHDPSWSLVYADSYAVILLKNNQENREIIEKFKITPENVEQRMSGLLKSPSFEDRVTAADTFNLLDLADLEAKTFLQIVDMWPEKGKIWMVMGERQIDKEPRLAITYLDKALAVGYKTAEAYYYLGVAYKNIGEYKKAAEALQKSLRIDSSRQETKKLLDNISAGKH